MKKQARERGVPELRGSWGRAAAGVPPTWHTKRLLRSALTRSFVFSIRASWVGAVRAPRGRGAPSPPEQGAGASPRDCSDYRGVPPAGPGPVAAVAAPGFPPL